MVMFFMLLLIVIPFVAAIESWVVKKDQVWSVAGLAGFALGAFVWNAYSYWIGMPMISVILLILACGSVIRMILAGREVFFKGLLVAVGSCILIFAAWQGLLEGMLNMEKVRNPMVLNPGGKAGSALIVYHPGGSSFQEKITKGLASGLAVEDWRVKIVTTGSAEAINISRYDLLVVSSPTYDWVPSRRIMSYIKSLSNLKGVSTAVIISGIRSTELSQATLEKAVRETGAKLVGSYPIWTLGSNRNMYGVSDPIEAMEREGIKLARLIRSSEM